MTTQEMDRETIEQIMELEKKRDDLKSDMVTNKMNIFKWNSEKDRILKELDREIGMEKRLNKEFGELTRLINNLKKSFE